MPLHAAGRPQARALRRGRSSTEHLDPQHGTAAPVDARRAAAHPRARRRGGRRGRGRDRLPAPRHREARRVAPLLGGRHAAGPGRLRLRHPQRARVRSGHREDRRDRGPASRELPARACSASSTASRATSSGTGPMGLDTGAMGQFLYAFRDRETLLDILEDITGAAHDVQLRPPGRCACNDITTTAEAKIRTFLDDVRRLPRGERRAAHGQRDLPGAGRAASA